MRLYAPFTENLLLLDLNSYSIIPPPLNDISIYLIVSNIKQRNFTLFTVLIWLRFLQQTLDELDVGMKESLSDVVTKALNKLCKQPEPPLDEIDDTILK